MGIDDGSGIQVVIRNHLHLILYKAEADLRAEAAKTYIGVLWWVLDPVLMMAVFYLVFAVLLQRGTEHFVQFLLIGLVAWRWFLGTVTSGANSIGGGAKGLMRQVYLPKIIFPLVVVVTDLFKFAVVVLLLLVFLWISGFAPNTAYLALPLLLLLQLVLIIGLTCLLAALVPFLPDMLIVVRHLLMMLFFLSGIFYSVDRIPPEYRDYFFLNPMAVLIDSYRGILMHAQWPPFGRLLGVLVLAVLINALAWWVLRTCDRLYPKLVTK